MNDAPNLNELRLVFWESTAGCNLQCRHCRRLDTSDEPCSEDLTTAQARGLIRDIRAVGTPIMVFSGGEPLMRPDILELAEFAHATGLPTALATNGTMIDVAMAGRIRDAHVRRVSVSLDGPDEATHNALRCQAGCFESACTGLRLLREAGLSTQINCTVARHNVDRLDDLYRLAVDLGADALHLFMLVPVGCGADLSAGEMLSADRYEQVLVWLHERSLAGRLQLKATCAPHYQRVVRMRNSEFGIRNKEAGHNVSKNSEFRIPHSAFVRGCLAGTGVCFVSHAGEVFPCGYLPVSCGNVLRGEFAAIWRDSPVFAQLRDTATLTGKCGLCEFVKVCSGCRARAYAATGDFLAEEPYCSYIPLRARS